MGRIAAVCPVATGPGQEKAFGFSMFILRRCGEVLGQGSALSLQAQTVTRLRAGCRSQAQDLVHRLTLGFRLRVMARGASQKSQCQSRGQALE